MNVLEHIAQQRARHVAEHEQLLADLDRMDELARRLLPPELLGDVQAAPKPSKPLEKPPAKARSSRTVQPDPPAPRPAARSTTAALEPVAAFIKANQPCSPQEIRDGLDISRTTLTRALRALRDAGTITVEGRTQDARYWITADRDQLAATMHGTDHSTQQRAASIRKRVLAEIQQEPYTEERLAAKLDLDRELVAVATGDLLLEDKVRLRPDGTYEPTSVAQVPANV